MRQYVALDAHRLTPWEQGSESALWWGTVTLIGALSAVYAALIASYFYLRQDTASWPPGNIPAMALTWPVVGTAVRFSSEPFMLLANRFTSKGNRVGLLVTLGISIILLCGWMLEVLEFSFSRPYSWRFGVYESLTWLLEAFPFCVAGALVIWGIFAWIYALRGGFTPRHRVGMQCLKLMWTAQFISWIFIWLVDYFAPRVFFNP